MCLKSDTANRTGKEHRDLLNSQKILEVIQMKKRMVTQESMKRFELFLKEDEKSNATIRKYMHDLENFAIYAQDSPVDKSLVLAYKNALEGNYAVSSANSMLAAMNSYLRFEGWHDCCVKQFKIQKKAYCSQEDELTREEYIRLLQTAVRNGNQRLYLILQTICATGIRVSEIEYITVEAVNRGEAEVHCKGKIRRVFIVSDLCEKLTDYAAERSISSGPVFRTRSGKPMSRCNIWREMKLLCEEAGVPEQKVYPHNLRHLFARTFYDMEKDIAKLADVLGHTNINTTRIYIITTGEEHKKKMEQMGLVL